MTFNPPETALAKIATIKGGKRLPAGKSLQSMPSKHPYIRVRDVGQRSLPREGIEYVPDDVFPSISRYVVQKNDVVLSIVGTIGALSIVDDFYDHASLTENCVKLTGLDYHDALYLYYYLSSSTGQQEISRGTVGAVQSKLPIYSIEKIKVLWPDDKDKRKKVASVLGNLDDRIDLNRRINQTLEAMAQAIFKSWFVDFDPVRAKIAALQQGRDPLRAAMSAISGKPDAELDALPPEQYDPLAATAALFPDEMEESELGEIPKGWRFSALGEECAYLNRGISPKYLEEGGVLVLNQKCIRDFSLDPFKGRRHDPTQRSVSGRLLQVGDVLVNSTGVGTLGRVAQVLRLDEPTIVDSHVTVVRAGGRLNNAFLGQWIFLKQPEIEAMGEGSTGQTELSRGKLANMPVLVPDGSVLGAFDAAVAPLKLFISTRHRESLVLQETRDALLPRLLSGELSPLAVLEGAEA